jgi:DNA recombination-dependent growth factor C
MGDKTLRFLVVILTIFSIWVVLQNTSERYKINRQHESEVKSLQDSILLIKAQKDSLYSELYPCEIELNRFQIALEIFLQENPKAAEQYSEIISSRTE